jgi:hypothetical protein
MTVGDPFAVFGLDRSADLTALRAARRRLAFELHPDRGGDPARMQEVNAAFDACVAHLTGRRPLPPVDGITSEPGPSTTTAQRPSSGPRREHASDSTRRARRWRDLERDAPSFTVDALPAETFEALLVVASWIGEVLDDDPPYVLECHLHDPGPCWCRLDVVPDAGGSTVSLTVARPDHVARGEQVTAEEVRDVWVEQLNRLGRPLP